MFFLTTIILDPSTSAPEVLLVHTIRHQPVIASNTSVHSMPTRYNNDGGPRAAKQPSRAVATPAPASQVGDIQSVLEYNKDNLVSFDLVVKFTCAEMRLWANQAAGSPEVRRAAAFFHSLVELFFDYTGYGKLALLVDNKGRNDISSGARDRFLERLSRLERYLVDPALTLTTEQLRDLDSLVNPEQGTESLDEAYTTKHPLEALDDGLFNLKPLLDMDRSLWARSKLSSKDLGK